MGQIMKLIELIPRINELDDELTIYAREPWQIDSEVILALEPEGGGLPQEAEKKKMKYFIEIFVASDFLNDWIQSLNNAPSDEERCRRLIHYAIHDA